MQSAETAAGTITLNRAASPFSHVGIKIATRNAIQPALRASSSGGTIMSASPGLIA